MQPSNQQKVFIALQAAVLRKVDVGVSQAEMQALLWSLWQRKPACPSHFALQVSCISSKIFPEMLSECPTALETSKAAFIIHSQDQQSPLL